jgi:hypothetical protein
MQFIKDSLYTSFEVEGAEVNTRNSPLSGNSVDHINGQCNAVVLHFLVIMLSSKFVVSDNQCRSCDTGLPESAPVQHGHVQVLEFRKVLLAEGTRHNSELA